MRPTPDRRRLPSISGDKGVDDPCICLKDGVARGRDISRKAGLEEGRSRRRQVSRNGPQSRPDDLMIQKGLLQNACSTHFAAAL